MKQVYVSANDDMLGQILLQLLQQLKQQDILANLIILIPNDLIRFHLQQAITYKLNGCVGIQFYTLAELAEAIRLRNDTSTKLPLSPCLSDWVIQRLFQQLKQERLGQAKEIPVPELLTIAIQQLKQAGVTPEQLYEIRASLSTHANIILEIWETYQQFLTEKGFYDTTDCLIRSLNLLEDDHPIAHLPIFIYGVWHLTWLEERFLEKLFRNTSVYVFVPFPSNNPIIQQLLHWLISLGFEEIVLSQAKLTNSMTKLGHRFFGETTTGDFKDFVEDITLISASTADQEARLLLQYIREKVRCGWNFGDMGILMASDSPYVPYIQDLFQQQHIPFQNGHRMLSQTSEAKLLLDILEVWRSAGHANALHGVVHSPILQLKATLPKDASACISATEWDELSLKLGIRGHWAEWNAKLEEIILHLEETQAIEPLTKARVWKEFLLFWQNWDMFLIKQPSYRSLGYYLANLYQKIVRPSAYVDMILKILLSLETIDRCEIAISWNHLYEILQNFLEHTPIPISFSPCAVVLCNFEAALSRPFPITMIPGMVEKEFLASSVAPSYILATEFQQIFKALQRPGLEWLLHAIQVHHQELFVKLAMINAKQLQLSFARLEPISGHERLPCLLFLTAASSLMGKSIYFSNLLECPFYRTIPGDYFWRLPPSQSLDELAYDFSMAKLGIAGDSLAWNMLLQRYPIFETAYQHLQEAWTSTSLTKYDGLIMNPDATRTLASYLPVQKVQDPHAWEIYAICPFRYFLKYVLELQFLPEIPLLPTVSLGHQKESLVRILQHFYNRMQSNPTEPENWDQCLLEASQTISSHIGPSNLEQILWQVARDKVLEYLERFLNTKPCMGIPMYFRKPYAQAETQKITLSLTKEKNVVWQGQIDQINIAGAESCESIQYCLDQRPPYPKDQQFCGGEQLQLAIDLLALRQSFPDYAAYRSSYYYLSTKEPKQTTFLSEYWQDTEKTLKTIVYYILHGMEKRYFFAAPSNAKCLYCPYLEICGPMRETNFELKSNDPRLLFYQRLKEIP